MSTPGWADMGERSAISTPASPGDDAGTISLPNGTVIPFRPIRPGDSGALQRFHRTLSDQSIYLRFFGFLPELTAERACYFTHLDGVDRFALDPAKPDTILAVVRFDRECSTDRAEYAAVVADRWQGHGIGLALTWRLIAAARRRGVDSALASEGGRDPETVRGVERIHDLIGTATAPSVGARAGNDAGEPVREVQDEGVRGGLTAGVSCEPARLLLGNRGGGHLDEQRLRGVNGERTATVGGEAAVVARIGWPTTDDGGAQHGRTSRNESGSLRAL